MATHKHMVSSYLTIRYSLRTWVTLWTMSLCHLSAVSAHSGRKIAYTSTAEMSICGYDITYSLVRMFFTLEYLVGLIPDVIVCWTCLC